MIVIGRLLDLFIDLCRHNSPPRCEGAVAARLADLLRADGLEVWFDEAGAAVGGECGNLLARLPANCANAPALFFSSHMDTVEPNPEVVIRVDGGVIHTDGSTILGADARAGLAPIVEAVRAVASSGLPHGDIELVFTVCEEVGLLGARHVDWSRLRARQGFVLDTVPPIGHVVVGAPYQDTIEVVILGRAAHAGAEPERGVSAITVAAKAIADMKLGRIDQETTANVGAISGGSASNVVCPRVTILAEARSRSLPSLLTQTHHMVECFEQAARRLAATTEITVTRTYDGYQLDESDPLVQLALGAASECGLEPGTRMVNSGSDANVFNCQGVQAVLVSTGMDRMHTHAECVSIADLERTARWVAGIIVRSAREAGC